MLIVGLAATMLLAACDDDHRHYFNGFDNGPGPLPAYGTEAYLQVAATSPDAPAVNVLIDGQVAFSNLDYGQATPQQPIDPSVTHSIAIQGLTPGAPTTLIGPTTLSFTAGTEYTLAAEGPVASIGAVSFSHPQTPIAAGAFRVQILHAAPSAPTISVYLTAPGAALASSAPLGTAAFKGSIGPTDLPAGQYEIRITAGGTTTPVLFDSGSVAFAAGADLSISAVQNTGPGSAPVFLAVVDANGHNSRLFDSATPATLRAVNDSPDAPALAILETASNPAAATVTLVPSLAFPNFTPYLALTAADALITAAPAGNTSDVLTGQNVNLAPGTEHSIYAAGKLAAIGAVVTKDDRRRIATQAKLRIIQGSPAAGFVDIYVAAPGVALSGLAPTYAGVPFTADTGFQGFAAGTYALTVTAAGSKTAELGPVSITLADDGIYTAVTRDAPGGGTPLGVIMLDDFTAPP
jgi:hypothetical protein